MEKIRKYYSEVSFECLGKKHVVKVPITKSNFWKLYEQMRGENFVEFYAYEDIVGFAFENANTRVNIYSFEV